MTNSAAAAAAATSLAASSKQSKQKQIVPSTNHSPTKPTSRSLSVEPRGRDDNNSNRLSSDRSQRAPTSGRQQKSGAMSSKQSKQPAPNLSAEMWASVEDLFWDHMKEVENKWNTLKLNDDIWAKLIYFERNRRLAKAYVSAPVLTVDGSTHGLDGFRIGLSGIDSTYRSLDSIDCLRSIGQGIKLKIDNHGNILIRRIGHTGAGAKSQNHCSVWIKDWPSNSSLAEENCMMRRILTTDISYKLFDMRKFRLMLEKRRLNNETNMDWRQCVSIISFVRSAPSDGESWSMAGDEPAQRTKELLDNPCWLMLINIIAMDMIKNTLASSNNNTWHMSPSGMVQNHSLVEIGGHRQAAPNRQVKSYKPPKKALKTSSSSSVLFPSPDGTDTLNSGAASEQSTTGDSSNDLVASVGDERVRKLRTTGGKYRMSPMKNNAYYRRYQSIQQLSSNNTIYTTFNSKYINRPPIRSSHHHQQQQQQQQLAADCSSTSDYNSASRSTSSGQLNHTLRSQQIQSPMDSLQAQIQSNNRCRAEGKVLFSRKALLPPGSLSSASPHLDLSTSKSVSLSAFDLSQPRRFNLRQMQSSIKMNYDYFSETEDLSDDYGDHEFADDNIGRSVAMLNAPVRTAPQQLDQKLPRFSRNETLDRGNSLAGGDVMVLGKHNYGSNPRLNNSATDCCNESLDGEKWCCSNNNKSLVNHNECSAIQGGGSSSELVRDTCANQNKKDGGNNKLLSKSSIASSTTSSSGCPDNDYFMSQSSSSMSSSSTAGTNCERDLFSQPPSSSGIICSTTGSSTNDELDDGQTANNNNNNNNPKSCNKASAKEMRAAKSIDSDRKLDDTTIADKENNSPKASKSQHVKVNKSANNKSRHQHQPPRRDYSGDQLDYCCNNRSAAGEINGCNCASIKYTCHCCCDCFFACARSTLELAPNPSEPCGWEDESIYQRLPPPSMLTRHSPPPPTNTEVSQTKTKKGENNRVTRNTPAAVGASKSAAEQDNHTKSITTKMGDSKQSVSWLEKRKYSKILPRFIFSSSTSSSGNNDACQSNPIKVQRNSYAIQQVQEKNSKFRFTRSTQDLS